MFSQHDKTDLVAMFFVVRYARSA